MTQYQEIQQSINILLDNIEKIETSQLIDIISKMIFDLSKYKNTVDKVLSNIDPSDSNYNNLYSLSADLAYAEYINQHKLDSIMNLKQSLELLKL